MNAVLQVLNQHLGIWKGRVPIPETSLNILEARLEGQEKELFLNFFRKMLQWKPEDRSDIQDVFMDEWLLADLIEAGEVVREE
jgi:serine/threonine-protein kinase SRPK3